MTQKTCIYRWLGRLWAAWRPRPAPSPFAAWDRDPLSHPALSRMSLTDLADLPFDPDRVAQE